jgi:hypothetical protein
MVKKTVSWHGPLKSKSQGAIRALGGQERTVLDHFLFHRDTRCHTALHRTAREETPTRLGPQISLAGAPSKPQTRTKAPNYRRSRLSECSSPSAPRIHETHGLSIESLIEIRRSALFEVLLRQLWMPQISCRSRIVPIAPFGRNETSRHHSCRGNLKILDAGSRAVFGRVLDFLVSRYRADCVI